MKKLLRITVFLAFLGIASNLLSQTPGFLGKRFIVQYGLSVGARINGEQPSYTGKFGLGINAKHFLGAQFIFSRSFVMGLAYTHQRLGMEVPYTDDDGTDHYRLSSSGLRLDLIKYVFKKRGNMAPIGLFVNWGLDHSGGSVYMLSGKDEVGHYKQFAVHFGIGGSYVFANRVTFSFGTEVAGIPLFAWVYNVKGSPESMRHMDTLSDIRDFTGRYRAASLMNFHIRVGCLIF